MDIPSKYDPQITESKWYDFWISQGFFQSTPDDREPYCVVIPPPNVTGVLHMGHMLNNTIQDVLVRRARMQGKNTLWVPGTDHASIATEAKVVDKLRAEGIEKSTLSREEFMAHAWEWKEKHGGIILEQLKKLGTSCDWSRTRFTMDEKMYEQVIAVFIDLYNKGLIYKGVRMVNWDPKALTAISDEEVNYVELQSKLYHVRYKIEGSDDEWVTIATTRPETILGDTAVCVHPDDPRYARVRGKRVLVPLINRSVPMIEDEYVDMEFGTGALKITPAHDINDYTIGNKYHLPTIDTFNPDGTMSEAAQLYIGEDRFVVREKIVKDLEAAGNLVKIEDYMNKVGYSERTHVPIEPRLSMQWFLRITELAAPALEVVMDDTVKFHPAKFKNTYRHWMENVKDWCISRQLWWGQRIPAYYLPNGEIIVAKSAEQALEMAHSRFPGRNFTASDLRQDEDVLDTWFSSWLWPISVFNGILEPDNEDINYYYPTNDLVTAPEILFFWVARMIMAGLEYRKEIPFKNVYLTGIVRDRQGRKMSKSLGNSPDPLDLIDQFGADGVRVGMLLTSPAGNDLPFEEVLCEQGRNFSNKIWNALRLVKGFEVSETIPQPDAAKAGSDWFESRLNQVLEIIEDHYSKYRLSDALMAVYKLVWDDFCSWYLEIIKPAYQQPIDKKTYDEVLGYFEKIMQVVHPFMPFITEEIWHHLQERKEGVSIMNTLMPKAGTINEDLLNGFEICRDVIISVRAIRKDKNIPMKETIKLFVRKNNESPDLTFDPIVMKLNNIDELTYVTEKVEGALSFVQKSTEFYIPVGDTIDIEAEIAKLKEELSYTQGFLNSVQKKLSNERFVAGAPQEVVNVELQKKADAEAKIQVLASQIATLKG
ncbi:MAG: valine--tRNA ligase [Bacteroidota bacterium]